MPKATLDLGNSIKVPKGEVFEKPSAMKKRFLQHLCVIPLVGVGFFGSLVAFGFVFETLWALPFLVLSLPLLILGFKLAARWDINISVGGSED